MALDLSMIPQVSAPSLSADFFKEMANARQTAFNGLISPIQDTAKAFVDNRTQQAQELIRQTQTVGGMQSPELQAGIQSIIDRSGGFVDQNAINQAQQDHLAQLYGNQVTYSNSDILDKAKTQEQVNLLVQQKIAQRDYEEARKIAQSSVTSDGLSTALSSISTAKNAPLLAQLEIQKQLKDLYKDSGTISNIFSSQALQYEKLAAQYEADAVKAESREIENALGQKVKDPAGAAEAARLRAQAAQLRGLIQYMSPQQVLGTLSGAYGEVGGTVKTGKVGNTEISEPQAKAASQAQSWGWNSGAVAGLMGNLHIEGGWDGGRGDGGKAQGIAQWHPDRQKNFQQVIGKPVSEATHEEQMNFIKWEVDTGNGLIPMTYNGKRYSVAEQQQLLTQTTDPAQAAVYWDVFYERSAGKHTKERAGHAVNYAQALSNNYQATTPSTVQAASTVTATASQGASSPTPAASSMNISSIPPEMQEKYKPYTDKKGNFLPIKFGNGKSIDTLDTELEALIAEGQAEIDKVYDNAAENRKLAGLGEGIAQRWYNPIGLANKHINLHNWVMEMPIYAKARSNNPILTTTELNEAIKATAEKLHGKFTSDDEKLKQLQLTISEAVSLKFNRSFTARNKKVADGLANLAKQYGTTPAVLEKVLTAKGKPVRMSSGSDAFFDTTDVTPQSSTSQSSSLVNNSPTPITRKTLADNMTKYKATQPPPDPRSIFSNLN